MKSVLPFTTNPEKHRGLGALKLLNPNSAEVKGPTTSCRRPTMIQEGVLQYWDADAVRAVMQLESTTVASSDLSWTDQESYWESNIGHCTTPDEVEALLPKKWFGYRVETEVDETLSRVCRLCTALVNKFVALSQNDEANRSASKWRLQKTLHDRLLAVMELLESSVGESVPILKLTDEGFMRDCWGHMDEEERLNVMSSLATMGLEEE